MLIVDLAINHMQGWLQARRYHRMVAQTARAGGSPA